MSARSDVVYNGPGGRFVVESQEQVTECECPENLCRHADGLRFFYEWVVLHAATGEPADTPLPTYPLRRDAVRVARQLAAVDQKDSVPPELER